MGKYNSRANRNITNLAKGEFGLLEVGASANINKMDIKCKSTTKVFGTKYNLVSF